MAFWILSGAMCLVVGLAVVTVLLRRQRLAGEALEYDLRVYRDQLKEVDRDVSRRVISPEDAERARTEIKRRILEADRKAQGSEGAGVAPSGATWAAAVLSLLVIGGGTYLVYFGSVGLLRNLGVPAEQIAIWQNGSDPESSGNPLIFSGIGAAGYPDFPIERRLAMAEETRKTRMPQAEAEARVPPPEPRTDLDADYLDLIEKLRVAVAEQPDDLAGVRLLYQHEANIGNFVAARKAMDRVLELAGDEATAQDLADHAEILVLSAGGYVSPEAENALVASLALDPRNGIARYYTGMMFAQTGRPDRTFRIWSQLLAESRPHAPWQQVIRSQIDEVAMRAGVDDYVPPPIGSAPAMRGPDAEQVEAAAGMSPTERMEMIDGMVTGLADRLDSEGGPPEDWAQLIRALGVLGRTEDAARYWNMAQEIFPDDVNRVPILQAARDAGVAQ